ncbi:MAG TPA: hypothetical protein G4N94_04550 [Caldilineae bacterium]|nr:hypothetical protein [Caldilineae bacterium]
MSEPTITVYGAYCRPDCRRSKQFLGEAQIPYRRVNIKQDAAGGQHQAGGQRRGRRGNSGIDDV